MRKNSPFLLLSFLVFSFAAKAQETMEITYQVLPILIEDDKEEKGVYTYFKLSLNENYSLYEYIERIQNNQDLGKSYGFIRKTGILQKDLKNNEFTENINIYGQDIILQDNLPEYPWKLEKETKNILDISVRKATALLNDFTEITAWYSPNLPAKHGPETYGGLPGLILELEIRTDYGDILEVKRYTATEIEVKNKELKTPPLSKKGKRMSLKEYQEFHKEQDRRFHEMYNSGVDKD